MYEADDSRARYARNLRTFATTNDDQVREEVGRAIGDYLYNESLNSMGGY